MTRGKVRIRGKVRVRVRGRVRGKVRGRSKLVNLVRIAYFR